MDEPPPRHPADLNRERFGPDRRLSAALLAVAVLVAGSAATTGDPAGRLLLVGAAVVLVLWGVSGLLFWPRLEADGAGLWVRTATMRGRLPWAGVTLRVDERTRFGLASRTLEVDADERLIVLSRWALGTDPRMAYARLVGVRPS